MAYELVGSGMAGFGRAGFGVNEFIDYVPPPPPKPVTVGNTSIGTKIGTRIPTTGLATVRVPAPPPPPPVLSVAPAAGQETPPSYTALMPASLPDPYALGPGDGAALSLSPADQCEALGRRYSAADQVCLPPGETVGGDDTLMYALGGGLVLAVGIGIFFATRKGK
jgi:hypothetical protein